MLEAAKRLTTSSLIPFVPRQVMLDTKFIKASQKEDKERRKEKEMEKEKKTKSKKTKSSQTLEDGSGVPETLTLDRANGGELPQKGKSREIFLRSIAAFLQTNGFDKTLSVFRSETQLENDGSMASFINLEDLFCKYLVSSKGYADAIVYWPEEKGLENGGACRNDESENIHDVSEHIHKKKRKHKNETDDGTKTEISEHGLENVSIKCMPVKSVEKDMNRSAPEGCSAEDNEVIGNKNRNELNSLGDTKDLKKLKSAENSHVESKGKKRKKKSVSDSLEENANKGHLEVSHETAKNTDDDNLLPKTNVNDKTKRKKKHKMSSDACDENTDCDHRKFQEIVKEEREELKSLTNNSSTLPAKTIAIHKAEKKMKTKATSDSLAGNGREEYVEEALRKSDSGKENAAVSEDNVDNIEKKAHKKRKRLASEEKTSLTENETITEESKHVELDENNRGRGALLKLDKSLPGTENATTGKKRKTDSEENPSAQDILKEFRGHQLANGNLVKNEKEGGTSLKSMKKEKHSAEPKTVNAFQRVKIDEVKFADERLQDNSYWALDGTGSGYGAKAQEVLGQVRGRDFRHEKTKKKRGTYRGGQIDLQAHSIKFNYSDEE